MCLTLIPKSRIADVNESDRRLFFIASGGDAALADLDRHDQAPGAARHIASDPHEHTRDPVPAI